MMQQYAKGKQYKDYNTYILKLLMGILQLRVSCHVWPNRIEHVTDYSIRFIGWKSKVNYKDMFVHSGMFVFMMHVCSNRPYRAKAPFCPCNSTRSHTKSCIGGQCPLSEILFCQKYCIKSHLHLFNRLLAILKLVAEG